MNATDVKRLIRSGETDEVEFNGGRKFGHWEVLI